MGNEYFPADATSDGRTLLLMRRNLVDKRGEILALDLDPEVDRGGGGGPRPLIDAPDLSVDAPRLSPAEDLVAFLVESNDGAPAVLKVTTFPKPSELVQVAPTPARAICCWRGADELCWTDDSGRAWVATVALKAGRLEVGEPRRLFDDAALGSESIILDYDRVRGRFLVSTLVSSPSPRQIVVMRDWRGAAGPPAAE
ncbi:MAG: hypothetical protein EBU70_13530 [Actinobacteria bacterium]|nr:hypothetical protein [Actinomycetota bacterium]